MNPDVYNQLKYFKASAVPDASLANQSVEARSRSFRRCLLGHDGCLLKKLEQCEPLAAMGDDVMIPWVPLPLRTGL